MTTHQQVLSNPMDMSIFSSPNVRTQQSPLPSIILPSRPYHQGRRGSEHRCLIRESVHDLWTCCGHHILELRKHGYQGPIQIEPYEEAHSYLRKQGPQDSSPAPPSNIVSRVELLDMVRKAFRGPRGEFLEKLTTHQARLLMDGTAEMLVHVAEIVERDGFVPAIGARRLGNWTAMFEGILDMERDGDEEVYSLSLK